MKMTPVKSSNIESIGYDADKKQLNVTFKNGKTFGYADVYEGEFKEVISYASVGVAINSIIKPFKVFYEILDADVAEASEGVAGAMSSLLIDIAFMKKQFLLIEQLALDNPNAKAILAVTRETISTFKDDDNA